MILIADSGSTKTDWVLLSKDGKKVKQVRTIGLNPYFVTSEIVYDEISGNELLQKYKDVISRVYFYGAGCCSDQNNQIIKRGIIRLFQNAHITVDHDLLAAAYAVYNGKPNLTCILGTGSNTCFFDGESLKIESISLGFILGDEGSGSNIGKRLLQSYFLKKMPADLTLKFEMEFELDANIVKKNVLNNPRANVYLASFNEFLTKHQNELFVQNLLYDSFKEFFLNQVLTFKQAKEVEINFVGSIAFFYMSVLKTIISEFNLKIGRIVQKPMDGLVNYHMSHLISK